MFFRQIPECIFLLCMMNPVGAFFNPGVCKRHILVPSPDIILSLEDKEIFHAVVLQSLSRHDPCHACAKYQNFGLFWSFTRWPSLSSVVEIQEEKQSSQWQTRELRFAVQPIISLPLVRYFLFACYLSVCLFV